jgi:ketosteroid isomerase-like protein
MSQENVESVRDSLQVLRGRGLDAYSAFWHPEINWRAMEGAPDDVGEMTGKDAVRRYAQDWFDTFDDFSTTAEEIVDLGGDRVLAVQRISGRAKLSGVETQYRYAVVYTLRDGLIVRGREYVDREQALKAVGLAE